MLANCIAGIMRIALYSRQALILNPARESLSERPFRFEKQEYDFSDHVVFLLMQPGPVRIFNFYIRTHFFAGKDYLAD
jgi:hypothetical protein